MQINSKTLMYLKSLCPFGSLSLLRPIMAIMVGLLLFACGSGSNNFTVANGGITGTGITMGRITNFGSIFVNGVRFDVDNAIFLRDGRPSSGQAEFSVGEYIVINGTVDTTGTLGTASEVLFDDILEGAVTRASTDDSTIEILGQIVKTDQLTIFHDFTALMDLLTGNVVEVSGVKDAAGIIIATSLKFKQAGFVVGISENELKGTIRNINISSQTFEINNITVEYGDASLEGFAGVPIQNGQFVEAKSDSVIMGHILIASEVELEEEFQSLTENTEVEIEGKVTRFISSANFDLNGLMVTTDAATEYDNGVATDIALNSFLEVEGQINTAGVLVAEEISFKETESAIEVEGNIESINLLENEIVISNQVVVINASTLMIDESKQPISPLTINDLLIGDAIEIKGIALDSGKILVIKLERENEEKEGNQDD